MIQYFLSLSSKPAKDQLFLSLPPRTKPKSPNQEGTEQSRGALMSSIMENFQKRSFFPTRPLPEDLPISTNQTQKTSTTTSCLRKRLSSLSVRIQSPITSTASAAASWSVRRSKSMSSIGEFAGGSVRRWWDWGVGWFLSRKPSFAQDLEINEEETAILGFNSKGSWRHLFFKVKFQLRKIVGLDCHGEGSKILRNGGFGYDSFSYRQNFDDGVKNLD